MPENAQFKAAFPYRVDVLALPVADIDIAAAWYTRHFGMTEVERRAQPLKSELESNGVNIGNWRVDQRDGKKLQVFFAVAPDGLCYYFHEPLQPEPGTNR